MCVCVICVFVLCYVCVLWVMCVCGNNYLFFLGYILPFSILFSRVVFFIMVGQGFSALHGVELMGGVWQTGFEAAVV